jgi:hypothetical protein
MNGIPRDLNLSDIVGSEIQQIRVGRYDVQFYFGSGRGINVQGDVDVLNGGRVIAEWREESGWSTVAFHKLLNTPVVGYSIPHERLLEIQFEGELSMRLHDSSEQYESMQIYPEGIIV